MSHDQLSEFKFYQNGGFSLRRLARNTAAVAAILIGAGNAVAADFNADAVLNKMDAVERNAYLAGIVDSLGFTRFLTDRPDETGMNCIYDWFYGNAEESRRTIHEWFSANPDQLPAALMYVLAKRECGG